MVMGTFTVAAQPELYISQRRALAVAQMVRRWGYRAKVWTRQNVNEIGFVVAVSSNNGFEGFAHAH